MKKVLILSTIGLVALINLGIERANAKGFYVIDDSFFEEHGLRTDLIDDLADQAPEAEFRIKTTDDYKEVDSGTMDTTFIFDAASTHDDNDSLGNLEFRFDFDNDGTPDTYFSKQTKTEYQFKSTGTKEVRLEVLDSAGNVGSIVHKVKIVQNTAPESYFSTDDADGPLSQEFVFRPVVSDGQHPERLLEVRFDFESDGVYDTKFSRAKTTRHTFDSVGVYKVTMQTKDPGLMTSTYSQTITVIPSTSPSINFDINTTSGNLDTRFRIDASGSTDAETPNDLEYRFDYDYKGENDIIYDTDFARSSRKVFIYKKAGTYTIRVEVRDPEGMASVAFKQVVVNL